MPLKTPLDERYTSQLPARSLFTPSMFLDSFASSNRKIGLWINLAFTDRFYDSAAIEKRDIKYVKLSCRGHGETPTAEQVDAFNTICVNFIKSNPNDLIAVHCTHGFNRTGFLIAAYLTLNEDWDLRAAVIEFAQKRPPGIYKQDYLEDLFKRYGDMDDCLPPPERPDWCYDEPEEPDDGGDDEKSNGTPHRKEFTKQNPTFMDGVRGTSVVSDGKELARIRMKVQRMVGWPSSGFPGAQPVSMTRENCRLLVDSKYMVSWKADGTRYMLLIEDRNHMYFIDRDNSVFQIHGMTFPSPKNFREDHIKDTLCDGEMVVDEDKSTKPPSHVPRFLIYDVIVLNGQTRREEKIANQNFEVRFEAIKQQLVDGRDRAIREGVLDRGSEPFGVRRKGFFDLSATEKVMNMNTGHEHDGLIFQPVPDPYTGGQCDRILKWKPPHLNSIDFKCQIQKFEPPGWLAETHAVFFVGGYPPIAFTRKKLNRLLLTTYREYDGKIVECTMKPGVGQMCEVDQILRIRTDKSHPNSHKTALSVLKSITEPVDKDFLLKMVYAARERMHGAEKRKGAMPPPLMPAKHAKI